MLFLAVFCGFLAENQREHFVEHNREKQYVRSLVEDLETDTLELQRAIEKALVVADYTDSVLLFFKSYRISDRVPKIFANLVGKAGQNQNIINTDRTSSQLKNSGAMRLIRNKKVSNLILQYWKQIDETNTSLNRYLLYRNSGRETAFKLWVIPEIYHVGKEDAEQLKVIDTDSRKWDELMNLMAISGSISRTAHLTNLQKQHDLAKELIATMRKEYNLN